MRRLCGNSGDFATTLLKQMTLKASMVGHINVRKLQDSDHQKKADKDEFQLIRMRLAPFEKFDPKEVASKLENLEVDGKHHLHLIDQLAEQVRKVEGYAAHRADVTKARAEVPNFVRPMSEGIAPSPGIGAAQEGINREMC